jgi:hypothetical protein
MWGCTTPSVPRPPPELSALSFSSAATPGLVQVTSKPSMFQANARFYIFDYDTGDGVITHTASDGSFTSMPFAGTDGNTVQMYYDTQQGERSQEVCTTLQRNVGLLSIQCP